MTPHELIERARMTPSDINEHFDVLKEYAECCSHITELGTRYGTSALAFLAACPRVISYDIVRLPHVDQVQAAFPQFAAMIGNSLEITIEPTDLLFIDTLHRYAQVKAELERHSPQVKRWIILHDTTTFGHEGDDGGPGILKAITEFLKEHLEWRFEESYENNNGLTVLHRVGGECEKHGTQFDL